MRIIIEQTKSAVASLAKKSANLSGLVAVVNAKLDSIRLVSANGASTVLLGEHRLVASYGQSVLALKLLLSLAFLAVFGKVEFATVRRSSRFTVFGVSILRLARAVFFAISLGPLGVVRRVARLAISCQSVLSSRIAAKHYAWKYGLTSWTKLLANLNFRANLVHLARRFKTVDASRVQNRLRFIPKPKLRSRLEQLTFGTFFMGGDLLRH